MNPIISVNISCYNRRVMLKECIESFINQTFIDWELILVDDGSRDDLTFVSNMDNRIKYYRQKHGGMAQGLNLAMEKSSGKYILVFGSDDLVTDINMLKEMAEAMENNPQIDIVYCDHWLRKEGGRTKRAKYDNIGIYNQKELYRRMLKKQLIAHGGTLWKKEKYPKYDETTNPAEDWDLFLTAVEKGLKFYHIPKKLWTYRVGHVRMSSDRKIMEEACKKVLLKRSIKI